MVVGERLTQKQAAAHRTAETALAAAKSEADAAKKEAGARMPVAPVKYKNPGIFSMGAAFLVGILMSLLFPEEKAADKFAEEKLREYVGIGAE
jgi:cation/acetate symporter